MAALDQWRNQIIGEPVVAGVENIEVGYVLLRLIIRTLPGRQFDVGREVRLRVVMALRTAGISTPALASTVPTASA
jgi:small conductance mechanosensitive channel